MFKTLTFARWSRKAQVSDKALVKAITEMATGLIDADLGGSVYKKRVSLPGRGKSGGADIGRDEACESLVPTLRFRQE